MSKRHASEEPLVEPESKKLHTEEEVPTNPEVVALEKNDNESMVTMRLLISTSMGDAIEDTERGILSKLKAISESVNLGEKVRGSPDRVVTSVGEPNQLADIVSQIAEFVTVSNWGKNIPGLEGAPAPPAKKGRGKAQAAAAAAAATAAAEEEEKLKREAKSYSVRILVPDIIVLNALKPPAGSGKINQLDAIESSTKAVLELSRSQLPSSTERSMVVRGGLDEIKAAIENLAKIFDSEKDNFDYFPTISYVPRVVTGIYGRPETFQRQVLNQALAATNPYLIPIADATNSAPVAATGDAMHTTEIQGDPSTVSSVAAAATTNTAIPVASANSGDDISHITTQSGMQQAQMQAQAALPGQQLTQQIFIPNDMVGAIIGKGGTKINEIRQTSGSMIRINEPNEGAEQGGVGAVSGGATHPAGSTGGERMVTIIGTPESNQMALYLLYQRIESERHHHMKK